MKYIKFFLIGILFGIIMTKSEIISWFRIQEMFRFHSFHMYGVIGSAVMLGVIQVLIMKKINFKNFKGEIIEFKNKKLGKYNNLFGGIIFGLGWALTGACPGPLYILIGNGYYVFIVVVLSAILGALSYGMIKDRLPH
ncbi:MAG: YeeE/YedE family protein [Flavobacteriaceae bacterium]|nr:YeeE/YedE family protein [Flavobacteriaceae bacterium]